RPARYLQKAFPDQTGKKSVVRSSRVGSGAPLLAEAQFLDDFPVAAHFVAFKVFQQTPPPPDQLQQAATGGVILLVSLEMLSQVRNSFTEYRDLNFRRPRIRRVNSKLV